MKTERLLSIVIYLLNYDRVSASKLAAHYEVSRMQKRIAAGHDCLTGRYGGFTLFLRQLEWLDVYRNPSSIII